MSRAKRSLVTCPARWRVDVASERIAPRIAGAEVEFPSEKVRSEIYSPDIEVPSEKVRSEIYNPDIEIESKCRERKIRSRHVRPVGEWMSRAKESLRA